MAYDDYLADGDNILRSSRLRLDRIERVLGKRDGDLLDVGCATGFFLKAAAERGFTPHGVDISRYCVDHIVEPAARVHCGTLEGARYPTARFDVITMWDVIEHLKDPARALSECRRIVKSDGALVVMTPNIESVIARVTRTRWVCYEDPHIHLFYYGPAQITRELDRAGWEVRSIGRFWHGGKHVPMNLVFERLEGYVPALAPAFRRLLASPVGRAVLYLDIGDNMVVYAVPKR